MSDDDGFHQHQAAYWQWAYGRVQAWLERIGDGRIVIDPECLNPAKKVPLAAWLATHMGEASLEFADERERRERVTRNVDRWVAYGKTTSGLGPEGMRSPDVR